jgi:hypothetical protein
MSDSAAHFDQVQAEVQEIAEVLQREQPDKTIAELWEEALSLLVLVEMSCHSYRTDDVTSAAPNSTPAAPPPQLPPPSVLCLLASQCLASQQLIVVPVQLSLSPRLVKVPQDLFILGLGHRPALTSLIRPTPLVCAFTLRLQCGDLGSQLSPLRLKTPELTFEQTQLVEDMKQAICKREIVLVMIRSTARSIGALRAHS